MSQLTLRLILPFCLLTPSSEAFLLSFAPTSASQTPSGARPLRIDNRHSLNAPTGKMTLLLPLLQMTGGQDFNDSSPPGDKLRASSGVRASLHPTTINAISEALLLRSSPISEMVIDVWKDDVEPLAVALSAGKIAAYALEKRKVSCEADGDEASMPTPEECQTVAGRVVGVVMRMRDLEDDLAAKVGNAGWVAKYGEYGSFGVLRSECAAAPPADAKESNGDDVSTGQEGTKREINAERESELCEKLRDDPLFRMCRAECLLAIFLQNVEAPKLEQIGEQVPGGSKIDFIDEDRIDVILS